MNPPAAAAALTTPATAKSEPVRVCAGVDVQDGVFKLVTHGQTPVAIYREHGKLFAIDNRCPHMGFPLCKGDVHEGIVVCPWHHWKFDLATGGCFSAGEYDVTAYDVFEKDGGVWLGAPALLGAERAFQRYEGALREGLKAADPFQIAKAVASYLRAGGDEKRLVRYAASLALSLGDDDGRGPWQGLTSLANAAHLAGYLEGEDRTLGLVQAFVEVARVIAGNTPRRPIHPLQPLEKNDPDRLHKLLLYFADKRTPIGVERCLATLSAMRLPIDTIAQQIFEAIAQHLYPSDGHTIDFAYRCFDLLDQVDPAGDLAPTALGSLAGNLANSGRNEESERWSPYVDRLFDLRARLKSGTLKPGVGGKINVGQLGHTLADATRFEGLDALEKALQNGATAGELSAALNVGWMLRLARYSLVNETDWFTVMHGVIAADSIDQAIRRFGGSPALIASVFDSTVQLYLACKRDDEAIDSYRQALAAAPQDADAICELAAALRQSSIDKNDPKPLTEARELVRAVLKANPNQEAAKRLAAAIK
ncbi:MAG TPA: Rieske 2Fe-2S domain-containing protein [Planctomycetota bacterium]|nr:Rieske 2Fe-2S domain-containing protein [Planctomycetota bacterium]